MALDRHLIPTTYPVALTDNVITGNGYRITLLTDRLFRIEKGEKFSDSATQMIWFRNLPIVKKEIKEEGNILTITTDRTTLVFDKAKKKALSVLIDGKQKKVSNKGNMKGTSRTLDNSWGSFQMVFPKWFSKPWCFHVEYEDGVLSNDGIAIIKDNSLLLSEKGELTARDNGRSDEYIFAYGKDYRGAVQGLYSISGKTPLLPRYALGNWWSRYKAYTQEEYIDLMQKFFDRNIPITVATIDMDWHWVNLDRFGKVPMGWTGLSSNGWTGYSWNTDLFPDYKGFLKWLKDHNLRTTLNLHPASGVRCFENMYEDMAKEMGIDPTTKTPIKFEIYNPKFINAYFKYLHKPYEKEGVDFWWMDWQQGSDPKVWGLDPLWSLNHFHTLDNSVDSEGKGKRGLILSRYAGIGSHRYPLGFSGDTAMNWKSLRYQPYFTLRASNIGYTWWSHDIGGHMFGKNDFELYLRWLQFGVFSPINRLHSTSNELMGKEPWKRAKNVGYFAEELLRLRHRLIPYLYNMNRRTNREGLAICEPLFYQYPDEKDAYSHKIRNEYFFGSEMIVAPITVKTHKNSGLATVEAWIPEGRWTDLFTGTVYNKKGFRTLARSIAEIPVLVKEGGIIPLSNDKGNSTDNPKDMEILIYRGEGHFELFEDDGVSLDYESRHGVTPMTVSEKNNKLTFTIEAVRGDATVIPATRNYTFSFKDIIGGKVKVDGKKLPAENYLTHNTLSIRVDNVSSETGIKITVEDYKVLVNQGLKERAVDICSSYQGSNLNHLMRFGKINKAKTEKAVAKAVKRSTFPAHIKSAILETYEEE